MMGGEVDVTVTVLTESASLYVKSGPPYTTTSSRLAKVAGLTLWNLSVSTSSQEIGTAMRTWFRKRKIQPVSSCGSGKA